MSTDLYKILGVERSATKDDMKKAYRRLAMKYHPDRNSDPKAETKFKEIQQAYSVLSDSQKKAHYDQFGTVDTNSGGHGFYSSGGAGFSDIFNDIFREFGDPFGHHSSTSAQQRGGDIQVKLEVTLEEAVQGFKKKITIPTMDYCENCDGSGITEKSKTIKCRNCDGTGVCRRQVAFISMQETCGNCGGSGQMVENPCKPCKGEGRVRKKKTIDIKIPAGIDNGDMVRSRDNGEAGYHGGPTGDLLIKIIVKPHEIFTRNGRNLHCEIPIRFTTAALGGEINVPTLEGIQKVKLPKGIQNGKKIRVNGYGVSDFRSNGNIKGDLICTILVEIPQNLSAEQKELITKLDNSLDKTDKHNPIISNWKNKFTGFLNKLKN